jgi:flagellar biosynthesis/type III secretory pathway protein FliH
MVLASYLKERWTKEAKEEGREEGRTEGSTQTQSEWETWNRRRVEAENRGEPFNEPPPTLK